MGWRFNGCGQIEREGKGGPEWHYLVCKSGIFPAAIRPWHACTRALYSNFSSFLILDTADMPEKKDKRLGGREIGR